MADLLVPLYGLPDGSAPPGFTFRKPMGCEGDQVKDWIRGSFSPGWASEINPAICSVPPTILLAVESATSRVAGFCAWDCTALGFLGPVGVSDAFRGKGIGAFLVLSVLQDMVEQGYGYAVVGDAGPAEFFVKSCGAIPIPNSGQGIYRKRQK